MAGMAALPALPVWRPPLPDDPLDAGRLGRRLDALSRVLDDLPGLAKRFARWQARRDFALAEGRAHRVSPLRGGRPPGGRLARYDPETRRRRRTRDVDEILAHAHALAHHALASAGPTRHEARRCPNPQAVTARRQSSGAWQGSLMCARQGS